MQANCYIKFMLIALLRTVLYRAPKVPEGDEQKSIVLLEQVLVTLWDFSGSVALNA